MEVKVYFNRKFPMSLVTPEVDITKDLEYVGSVELPYSSKILSIVFQKLQLDDENLEIKLTRSLSVGDVLAFKHVGEPTKFCMIDHVGFKLL